MLRIVALLCRPVPGESGFQPNPEPMTFGLAAVEGLRFLTVIPVELLLRLELARERFSEMMRQ
jgi:hypothetical protein